MVSDQLDSALISEKKNMISIENSVLEMQFFSEKLTKNDKNKNKNRKNNCRYEAIQFFLSKKIILAEKVLNFLRNQKICLDFIELKLNEKNWNGK